MSADLVETPTSVDPLARAWDRRPGVVGWLGQCNHKAVGRRFMVTAMVMFLVAGAMAVALRSQLAVADAGVMGPDLYGQLFTLHGTLMMFFFAVPMLEGLAIYALPLQLGARDMPMPRLNAFGYWLYLLGGVLLLVSFLTGTAPDGGWYAYPPLTSSAFSPGAGIDVWLLAVSLTEISAIVASIEIIALVMRSRAPGMSLARMPMFAWANLATATMILVAFPPLVITSLLLEVERKLGTPFFDPSSGGDPLLWQHLFWWFGHPEVYIQLLPALGILATVIPVATRRRLPMRWLVVASFLAIAIVSFGLWVHHMFTVGIPQVALQFFSAASFMITIPTGIVVLAFIAALWTGRVQRWDTATLFSIGFLVIFVFGGITGVMVAVVSFNWQSHDTYFVVGHFHSVLIGGVVFPIFAGLYHWFPKITGRHVSARAGAWSFGLMLLGFLATFVPQHVVGMLGMTRRTWTYPDGLGWEVWNLVSSAGSGILGLGVLVSVVAFAFAWRRGPATPADPWGGPTLEWSMPSPPPGHNVVHPAVVSDAHPRWDAGSRPDPVEGEGWYRALEDPADGHREALLTTPVDGAPSAVAVLPGFSLWPLGLAVAIGVLLLGVLLDAYGLALVGLVAVVGGVVGWLWPPLPRAIPGSAGPVRGQRPVGATGRSIGWWGAVLGVVVLAHLVGAALVAAWYLRAGAAMWPPEGVDLPGFGGLVAAAALAVAGAALLAVAHRTLRRSQVTPAIGVLVVGALVVGAAIVARLPTSLTADLPVSADAAVAIWWLVGAIDVVLLGVLVLMALTLAVHVWRGAVTPDHHAEAGVVTLWATATAVAVALDTTVLWALTRWWT